MVFFSADPFETQNLESSLTSSEKSYLHDSLEHMKGCRGRNCALQRKGSQLAGQSVLEQQPEMANSSVTFRGNSKRKYNNNIGKLKYKHNISENVIQPLTFSTDFDNQMPPTSPKKRIK